MSKETRAFEKNFAKKIGAKFALMVNSGSSANLIALFASINPLQKNYLKKGDEVIIPAICWSTSLWPIVQVCSGQGVSLFKIYSIITNLLNKSIT